MIRNIIRAVVIICIFMAFIVVLWLAAKAGFFNGMHS